MFLHCGIAQTRRKRELKAKVVDVKKSLHAKRKEEMVRQSVGHNTMAARIPPHYAASAPLLLIEFVGAAAHLS